MRFAFSEMRWSSPCAGGTLAGRVESASFVASTVSVGTEVSIRLPELTNGFQLGGFGSRAMDVLKEEKQAGGLAWTCKKPSRCQLTRRPGGQDA